MKHLKFLFSLLLTVVGSTAVSHATGADVKVVFGTAVAIQSLVEVVPAGVSPAITLGQGFRPYVLETLKSITEGSTPQFKLDEFGFLNMLMRQRKPNILRLNNSRGHRKSVSVEAKQRFTVDFTDTAKSCDQTNQITKYEVDVDLSATRQIAIHVEDETIAQYMDDASRTVAVGAPPTPMMMEFIEDIMLSANALLEGINTDLSTTAAAAVGVNRVTGDNNAQTLNINKDGDVNPLTDGVTKLLSDYRRNQAKGRPQIVGSGLFYNHVLQQIAKSPNQSGLDTRIMASTFDFYHDLQFEDAFGADEIVVYEPNAVQLVEYMEYTGFKAGEKPGRSIFGTLPLPMQMGSDITPVEFDFQLRYNDCQETLTDSYYGTSLVLEKGFNLIISKQVGLFTIPSGAYRATDVLNGNRGSYRYAVTNNCDSCS